MKFDIDSYDLDKTAQALWVMNDAVRRDFTDVEHFKVFIHDTIHETCVKNTSVGTYGFQLTAFDGLDDMRVVKISVSASLAASFASKVTKVLDAVNALNI